MPRVLIAAGGTGGHIYPGIAVAKELMRRDETSEVLFVGTAKGLETRIVPENGFQLSVIKSAGLKNVGLKGKVRGMMILPKSFLEAWKLIRDYRPNVVIGAGGYVSGPVLLTAALMGRRTLVMDSNALPGFTNRKLAKFVDKAALTFEEAVPFFGKKATVTGNPVRDEFFEIEFEEPQKPLRLLVFGGSQGSQAINRAVTAATEFLDKDAYSIVHQTGEADRETVSSAYETAGWDVKVLPYITNMVDSFREADLIICRAGATTCAEVAAAGKPAIMIPLPTAADDHQRKNAEALVRAGAAEMILQSDLNGQALADKIDGLRREPARLVEMSRSARKLARPDAAAATVDIIEELAKK
ncbi:MAG: undecaprenyldiphospho-muramoylpentapeptide beta-N-acetylglucosaminyltransferase [Acidobacteria bacterium ACB1]|nr:UDP-N-acetylglucosamine--N-acetylmuramyl-(pentapeptide) pyrophosphoryl-undecaprenol N-acetylglucosamine transferase [Pyrinomonadaceae bacterium]MCE7963271.1 undecaprenyldiphospho-muramoylpentapeptide beta-N-acetylglucosaminyltransferase [Acidobacteria bacterium ACB1]RIJ89956.1 MAG: undecaprenyldiphospho-muramoylpentapeptide beta-N-acetylglucosaminyltransferase [Acidobacteriota bacterium]